MRALNILHTVEHYYPQTGGSELVVQNISERLAARGHNVVVATSKHPSRRSDSHNGVRIVEFDVCGSICAGIRGEQVGEYQDYINTSSADVMLNYAAQQWATDIALTSLGGARANKVNMLAPCGYSGLIDPQTPRSKEFEAYFKQLLPSILPLYDACIYHSAIYKDFHYAEHHKLRNSVVVPNGVDQAEFESSDVVQFKAKHGITSRFMLLCVANFFPRKGHDRLIDIFKRWGRHDSTLVLIGNDHGTLAEMKERASGLNVRFLENTPRNEVIAAYREADLFLFASEIEASPLVIIEAKASRLPFISTDCGNVREWKGGVVCQLGEFPHHGDILLDDVSQRKELGRVGHDEWKRRLTWDKVVDQYEELYQKLCQLKQTLNK